MISKVAPLICIEDSIFLHGHVAHSAFVFGCFWGFFLDVCGKRAQPVFFKLVLLICMRIVTVCMAMR